MIQALNPSQELLDTIQRVNKGFSETKDLIIHAYNLAIRDGFIPIQAKQFLMANITFVGERTIRNALPDEAKDESKIRESTSKLRKNLPQNTESKSKEGENITTNEQTPEELEAELNQWKNQQQQTIQKVQSTGVLPLPSQIENPLNTAEPFRVAILDPEKARDEVLRQLKRLQAQGWKVIELTPRYIS